MLPVLLLVHCKKKILDKYGKMYLSAIDILNKNNAKPPDKGGLAFNDYIV